MDQPAQSLYQLNEGRVYWDPYKHLRVNGMHPHYSLPGHDATINREIPPNPIRHVKWPLEQFARFNVKHYPGSKLTSRGRTDLVLYHPRYNDFKPRSLSDLEEPLDMSWMFYPPEGEEWIKPRREENEESERVRKSSELHPAKPPESDRATSIHIEPRTMRPIYRRHDQQNDISHRTQAQRSGVVTRATRPKATRNTNSRARIRIRRLKLIPNQCYE